VPWGGRRQTVAGVAVRARFCAGTTGSTGLADVGAGVGAGVLETMLIARLAAVRAVERVLVVRFGLATEAARFAGRVLVLFATGLAGADVVTGLAWAGLTVRFGAALTVVLAAGFTVLFVAGLTVRFAAALTVLFAAGFTVLFAAGFTVLFAAALTVALMAGLTVDFAAGLPVDFAAGFTVDFAAGFTVDFAAGFTVLLVMVFVVLFAAGFTVVFVVVFAAGFTVRFGAVFAAAGCSTLAPALRRTAARAIIAPRRVAYEPEVTRTWPLLPCSENRNLPAASLLIVYFAGTSASR
jgi:hypothetical protein